MSKMFINLHVHSQYSLLDSCLRLEDLVNKNKQLTIDFNNKTGEQHQAYSCITDHGNLYAVMFHYNEAMKHNVLPIIGEEFYVTDDMFNKDIEHYRSYKNEHMIILAKNMDGYKKISALASAAATKGFYYKPRIDDKCLEELGTENLIATTACIAGRIPRCILKDDITAAKQWIAYYNKLFHEEFYLEIQPTIIPEQVRVNEVLISLSKEMGIPLIATTDAHYLTQKDKEAHDVLLCMQSKDVMSNPNRWTYKGNTYYIMSKEEIIAAFKTHGHENLDQQAILDAIERTEDIAKQCHTEFVTNKHYLPSVQIPNDNEEYNEWKRLANINALPKTSYLEYLFLKGLYEKKALTKKNRIRAAHEMKVIQEMGFETYFILYKQIIDFVRKKAKIPCGPGRGCVTANNMVQTSEGLKDIKEITTNDYVLSVDEQYHKVTNCFAYDINEELLSLTIEDKSITGITKDHKILAIRKRDFLSNMRIAQWIKAEDLEIGDYICEAELQKM